MARTNIDIDDRLVSKGLRTFKCKSKRELVHLALTELLKKAYAEGDPKASRSGEVGG